ncbi:phosphoribosyltransferase domain-containing protein [Deinococcus sedimenti]|uniref:Phosphoribosyltransferase n=1 Tax=Deinococcus sedimenti TaxID=1867090 RepID=A0ABQ2S6Y2_9DEIO|nr:phosphoribosyltransferase domain-containing protein [Deinococcus sedimenti]GGS03738.1 hypothetical protein GCM10008960_32840 [Deinococcus sedimenti]
MPTEHHVTLPSGTLRLTVERELQPLSDLVKYAVRENPKRGFLFVSTVLGKHIPTLPERAAWTHQALARALPPLTWPHFIGLAETATALAEGVHAEWQALWPDVQSSYQHTTRYLTGEAVLLRFDEPHSHAPAHILHQPDGDVSGVRELVLVDDEITTGTTLTNLARAWCDLYPQVDRIILICLTSWADPAALQARVTPLLHLLSLTQGKYEFTPNPTWPSPVTPPVHGTDGVSRTHLQQSRRTASRPLTLPDMEALGLTGASRLLVLGTGEHQYPAYALARHLQDQVAQVRFSATTRSPVLPGLAMTRKLTFTDNYGDGMPNYLYNVDPDVYSDIIVVHEPGCDVPELLALLGRHARSVIL